MATSHSLRLITLTGGATTRLAGTITVTDSGGDRWLRVNSNGYTLAVTVSILASTSATAGRLRVAPNGDAAAGELVWDAALSAATGVFTVPVNPDGTITVEADTSTSVEVSVTGYWKEPVSQDTGMGLHLG